MNSLDYLPKAIAEKTHGLWFHKPYCVWPFGYHYAERHGFLEVLRYFAAASKQKKSLLTVKQYEQCKPPVLVYVDEARPSKWTQSLLSSCKANNIRVCSVSEYYILGVNAMLNRDNLPIAVVPEVLLAQGHTFHTPHVLVPRTNAKYNSKINILLAQRMLTYSVSVDEIPLLVHELTLLYK